MKIRTIQEQLKIVEELVDQVAPIYHTIAVHDGRDNMVYVVNRLTKKHVYINRSETPMSIVKKLRRII